MPIPNPLAPVKGAGTTLWLYTGTGNAFANPLSDIDWNRLAKINRMTTPTLMMRTPTGTRPLRVQNRQGIHHLRLPGSRENRDRKNWSPGLTMVLSGCTRLNIRMVPSTFSAAGAAAWVKLSRQKRSLPAQRKSPIPASPNWLKKVVLRPLLLQALRWINPRQASPLQRPSRSM